MASNLRRLLGAVLALLVAGGLGVGAALAHADYARSAPGAGAVIATAPAEVVIWFTQDMFRRQGENWITVFGPNGEEVQSGEAAIDDDDRRQLSVALLPDLPAGEYTVTWRTLSAEDGDDHDGSFNFTLDPQASVTSTPMSAAATPTPLPPTQPPVEAQPTSTPPASTNVGCGAALLPVMGLVVLGARDRRERRA